MRKELTARLVRFLKLLVKIAVIWIYKKFCVLYFDTPKFLSKSSGFNLYSIRAIITYNCPGQYICNRSIYDFFLLISVTLKNVLSDVWQIHSVQLCIHYLLISWLWTSVHFVLTQTVHISLFYLYHLQSFCFLYLS